MTNTSYIGLLIHWVRVRYPSVKGRRHISGLDLFSSADCLFWSVNSEEIEIAFYFSYYTFFFFLSHYNYKLKKEIVNDTVL